MRSLVFSHRLPAACFSRLLLCLSALAAGGAFPAFAAVEEPDAPSLAFLGVNADAEKLITLFVGTREPEGAVLVDRGATDALLRERSLLLQAPETAEERGHLQQWVSADLLVVVEAVESEEGAADPDLIRCRAVDVVTGVRLVDEILAVDLEQPEAGLDSLDALLRDLAVPSWRTLWGKGAAFAGVTLLDIRLVDAGTEERRAFSPLYRLLQRMIVRDASMVLLERNLLDLLREEESLSPDLRLNLRTGLVLLSGTIHQETGGAVFTLRGVTASDEHVFEEKFPLTGDVWPIDIARRAMEHLSRHFSSGRNAGKPNLRREAERFHRLARYYHSRKDSDRAMDAALTAHALDPRDPEIAQSLYSIKYERVMTAVLNLRDPAHGVLSELLDEVDQLFYHQPSLRQYSHDRTSGKHLMSSVRSRFGKEIESDPGHHSQWRRIESLYRRSLERFMDRTTSVYNPDREVRDILIASLLDSWRPVLPSHMKYILNEDWRGKPLWPNAVPLEDLVRLMEIMESRPNISANYHRDLEMPFDPDRDDLYIRNLILSALGFAASQYDEVWRKTTEHHMRQCALLIVQNPLLWTRNQNNVVFNSSTAYRAQFQTVFAETRRQVEEKGWFVPELYFLDDWGRRPEVKAKAVDASLRLVSATDKHARFLSKRQELTQRLTQWFNPETTRRKQPVFPEMESNALSFADLPEDAAGTPQEDDHEFAGTTRSTTETTFFHGVAFGDYWVAHAGKGTLEVYAPHPGGIRRIRRFQVSRSKVATRIDAFNDKKFYKVLLGGKRNLYFSDQHSLHQFDREMKLARSLDLAEWGFPDHMVSNLLETPRGVFLVLTKQHNHKEFDARGRVSGWTTRNNGGVLVLTNDRLRPVRILANVERPSPMNELEAFGPFDAGALFEDANGTVLLEANLHSTNKSAWFEIGKDLVPRQRKYPGRKHLIRAWVASFNTESNQDADFMSSFCLNMGENFGLRWPYMPGARPGNSFNFNRVVPVAGGLLVLGTPPGADTRYGRPGLFYLSGDGSHDEVRKVIKLSGKEKFYSMALWGEDVVLTGRKPRHRVVRKEALESFLANGNSRPLDESPFPSPEHFSAQIAMQKGYKSEVEPFVASDAPPSLAGPLDHLVQIPRGRFPLFSPDNRTPETTWVTFPDLWMSETKVTYEEFFRVYTWAIHNGYRFSAVLEFSGYLDRLAQRSTRPVPDIAGIDAMLYCNARSEWEGLRPAYYVDPGRQRVLRSAAGNAYWDDKRWTNQHVDWNAGYRLPTELEWERVARGADPDHVARFPWGNTISHDRANYLATDFYAYDFSSGGLHPLMAGQVRPIANVKAFPPHGFENRFYGLVGNVAEIVWDRRGKKTGSSSRPIRFKGGSWATTARFCVIDASLPYGKSIVRDHGFRVVLPSHPDMNAAAKESTP